MKKLLLSVFFVATVILCSTQVTRAQTNSIPAISINGSTFLAIQRGVDFTTNITNAAPNSRLYLDLISVSDGHVDRDGLMGTTDANGHFDFFKKGNDPDGGMSVGKYIATVHTKDVAGVRNSQISNQLVFYITDGSPVGSLGHLDASKLLLTGWVLDSDNPSPVVELNIDGFYFRRYPANTYDAVSKKNIGFSIPVPTIIRDGKSHVITVTALNGGVGKDLQLNTITQVIPGSYANLGTTRNTGLTTYGYHAANGGGVFSQSEMKDLARYTSTFYILHSDFTATVKSTLATLKKTATLDIQDIFFEEDPSMMDNGKPVYGYNDFDLRSDYVSRWSVFVNEKMALLTSDVIDTFYLADEPYHRNITYADLKKAAGLVKRTFPGMHIAVTESVTGGLELFSAPSEIDRVGFDVYGIKDPATSPLYLKALALLRSKLLSNQNIFLVLDGMWSAGMHGGRGLTKEQMADVAQSYYRVAQYTPRVYGMYIFTWRTFGEGGATLFGTKDLPLVVRDAHKAIGVQILDSKKNDVQAPTVPNNLMGISSGSTQINLAWTASADDVYVAGYRG
jgi:hypothetical protein